MKSDIKLYEDLLESCKLSESEPFSFMNFTVEETKELLLKDLSLEDGMEIVRKSLPKFDADSMILDIDLRISGSESRIALRYLDDEFVYKFNNPEMRALDGKFNTYIWSFLLQEYLFPQFKYQDFMVYKNEIFMKQLMAGPLDLDNPTTQDQIDDIMYSIDCPFNQRVNGYLVELETAILVIQDLNPSNCVVVNNDIQGFDPRFKIIFK